MMNGVNLPGFFSQFRGYFYKPNLFGSAAQLHVCPSSAAVGYVRGK